MMSSSGVVDGGRGSSDGRRLSCVSRESEPCLLAVGRAVVRLVRVFEPSEMDDEEELAAARTWSLLVLSTMDRERSLPDLESSLASFEPCGVDVGGGDWDCLGDVEDVADMKREGSSPS